MVYNLNFLTKANAQNLLKKYRFEETLIKSPKQHRQQIQDRKTIT